MEKDTSSEYRQIVKATSIYGGVQVITILVAIIRSKSVALLLGPAGMGVNNILNETLNLIRTFSGVGLQTSAIKSISQANASNDEFKIGQVIQVFRGWSLVTGLFGFFITLITAPYLSRLAFGNSSYTNSFIFISISILITQLSVSYSVIFQGLRQVVILAKTAVWGAIFGLLTSVPLYYWLGDRGIEVAIIVSSITTLIIAFFYSSIIKFAKIDVSWSQFFAIGRSMLILGFMLSLSGLITMSANYIVRIYISRVAGLEEVGLFSAGFTVLNSYVSLIFTALATDYYPKLALMAEDLKARNQAINSQSEIAILIIGPVLCFFMVFIDWAIIGLYSEKFLDIKSMLQWGGAGMYFKTASWALGYLILAKGNSKLFFFNELFSNIYLLLLNILGYHLYGLTGLGISFLIGYTVFLFHNYFVIRKFYDFNFTTPFLRLFLVQIFLGFCCLVVSLFLSGILAKTIGSFFAILSIYFSWVELDKRMKLNSLILQLRLRFRKHNNF